MSPNMYNWVQQILVNNMPVDVGRSDILGSEVVKYLPGLDSKFDVQLATRKDTAGFYDY